MSQIPLRTPPPLGYQVTGTTWQSQDESHLSTLKICHYVFGGILIVFSSFFIVHIIMGAMIVTGKLPMTPPPGQFVIMPAGSHAAPFSQNMQWMGWIFIVMGSLAVGSGWTIGILAIISGVCIAQRRRRTFSLVVAGICCAAMPIGTVLGVFTILVLQRDTVNASYR